MSDVGEMSFQKFIRERNRMCSSRSSCKGCPFDEEDDCDAFIFSYPEEAETIITEWLKEHPPMTNLERLTYLLKKEFNVELSGIELSLDLTSSFWKEEYIEKESEEE